MIYPPDQAEMFQVGDHVAQGGLFRLPTPEPRPEPVAALCAACGVSQGRCDCNALGFVAGELEPLEAFEPCAVCLKPLGDIDPHLPGTIGKVHPECCEECRP